MDTFAARVRVHWDTGGHPSPDIRRVVASGPGLPPIAVMLHRAPAASRRNGADCADEHLVADADGDGPWPPVADVLIVRGSLRRRAEMWAVFPGWLVAVFGEPGKPHFLVVPPGWLARLMPLAPGVCEIWPYASFVHAWVVAGRPLDALHGARLVDGPPGHGVRVIVVEHSTAWPAAA